MAFYAVFSGPIREHKREHRIEPLNRAVLRAFANSVSKGPGVAGLLSKCLHHKHLFVSQVGSETNFTLLSLARVTHIHVSNRCVSARTFLRILRLDQEHAHWLREDFDN